MHKINTLISNVGLNRSHEIGFLETRPNESRSILEHFHMSKTSGKPSIEKSTLINSESETTCTRIGPSS